MHCPGQYWRDVYGCLETRLPDSFLCIKWKGHEEHFVDCFQCIVTLSVVMCWFVRNVANAVIHIFPFCSLWMRNIVSAILSTTKAASIYRWLRWEHRQRDVLVAFFCRYSSRQRKRIQSSPYTNLCLRLRLTRPEDCNLPNASLGDWPFAVSLFWSLVHARTRLGSTSRLLSRHVCLSSGGIFFPCIVCSLKPTESLALASVTMMVSTSRLSSRCGWSWVGQTLFWGEMWSLRPTNLVLGNVRVETNWICGARRYDTEKYDEAVVKIQNLFRGRRARDRVMPYSLIDQDSLMG